MNIALWIVAGIGAALVLMAIALFVAIGRLA